MKKATATSDRKTLTSLQQIVNIGPSIAGDLNRIGITRPQQLIGKDPHALYRKICKHDGTTHDPCLIDCLMSAVSYMNGAAPKSWWKFTPERKRQLGS